jgi:hypothetical protein
VIPSSFYYLLILIGSQKVGQSRHHRLRKSQAPRP